MRKKTRFLLLLIPIAITLVFAGISLFIFLKGPIGSYEPDPFDNLEGQHLILGSTTNHDPINITSNANFTPFNGVTGGAGTFSSPWIIEGWKFYLLGKSSGILIANTTDFLVIRRCQLWQASPEIFRAGIILQNVTNVLLENNNIQDCGWCGIYLKGTNNTVLSENWCWDNEYYGIYLQHSDNNSLEKNNCSNNGYGISVSESNNNSLLGNTLVNSPLDCISIVNSNNNAMTDNLCAFSEIGIELDNSFLNTIQDNLIKNAYFGIHIDWESEENSILTNYIDWCRKGIDTKPDLTNTIENNVVSLATIVEWFQLDLETNAIGFGTYYLILGMIGSWITCLTIIIVPWIKQRRDIRQQIKNANDLDRLKTEHKAIITQLDNGHK